MKYFTKILKLTVMMGVVIILSTLGIDAFDNREDFSGSLLGSVIGVKTKEVSRCPEGMSFISSSKGSFCIDTFTASVGEGCPYANPTSQSETRENLETLGCKPVSQKNAVPWRYISQIQAQKACSLTQKHLASGREWYEAAQGTPSFNLGVEGCNLYDVWEKSPDKTGSGIKCVSAFGPYDMIGNVWEWVNETVYDGFIENQKLPDSGYVTSINTNGVVLETDPVHPNENYDNDYFWINPEGTRGVMRGGFFGSGTDGGVYSFHAEMTPDFSGRAVGFRCASELNH